MRELSRLVLLSGENGEKFHFVVFSHDMRSLQPRLLRASGLPESGRATAVIPLPRSSAAAVPCAARTGPKALPGAAVGNERDGRMGFGSTSGSCWAPILASLELSD